jgi:hypothetical protein
MSTYIYKLGHCPVLSQVEFALLSQSDYEADNLWLHSSYDINVNKTGSIVFGAEVISVMNEFDEGEVLTKIGNHLSNNPSKKIGLFLPRISTKAIFSTVKKYCSKINISQSIPNFGHWKQTNNWLILIPFKNRIVLAKLNSYSDQEFWTNLDGTLPEADMRRGIINLKLARSLLNLTNQKNIWDSFAGLGRVPISGFDLKDNFWFSDLDERVITSLKKNIDTANSFWKNNTLDKKPNTEIAKTIQVWTQNASKLPTIEIDQKISIVTEGTLGQNFDRPPTYDQAEEQAYKVNIIWQELINNYKDSNIDEIVGCLPFYPKINFIPHYDFLDSKDWELIPLHHRHHTILYSRSNSLVGHLIFKITRKKITPREEL